MSDFLKSGTGFNWFVLRRKK